MITIYDHSWDLLVFSLPISTLRTHAKIKNEKKSSLQGTCVLDKAGTCAGKQYL